jgi:hypothetical protein
VPLEKLPKLGRPPAAGWAVVDEPNVLDCPNAGAAGVDDVDEAPPNANGVESVLAAAAPPKVNVELLLPKAGGAVVGTELAPNALEPKIDGLFSVAAGG